ncbi:hypothetical protein N0V82_008958 [Gnomoniopsis sp. IMI 355080]|nr:hypothetical protein N0V82_008958 [Gnomoniopsis sp. IMI 355080]
MSNRLNLALPFSVCQAEGCMKRERLMRCSACHVVTYCSRDHQTAHRPAHKFQCNLVKKSLAKLSEEDAKLRAHTEDDLELPANPFETAVGHFYGMVPTRPYMSARYDVVINQLNIRTGEAVEAALANLLDMLRLSRGDNMGVRSQVPALYLRLGRDQEAFDFLKWYADVSPDFDWGDVEQPMLDVKGADAFAPLPLERSGLAMDLSFKLALLLLKARLFVDVSLLEGFLQKLGKDAPADKMEIVEEEAMSDILSHRRDIVDAADYTPIMATLRRQMVDIYTNIMKHNKYIIPGLEDPTRYSAAQPRAYSLGDEGEAILAYRHSWYSWAECPTVLQQILPLLKDVYRGERP